MDVNSVRWLNYHQDEPAARKAFSTLKASTLGGPGKLELRYARETGDWLVVLYNVICGTSESLENAYGIPTCRNADSWFPYEGAAKLNNYAATSTVKDAFRVPTTIDGLKKAAREMAGQYYCARPAVMCSDEALMRLRSVEAKKTERVTGPARQQAHRPANEADSRSQIRFKCKHCGKTLVVKEQLAGRRGKCPKCKKVLNIPKPAASEGAMKQDSLEDLDIDALAASILDTPEESPDRNRAKHAKQQPPPSTPVSCPSHFTSNSMSEPNMGWEAGSSLKDRPSPNRLVKRVLNDQKGPSKAEWLALCAVGAVGGTICWGVLLSLFFTGQLPRWQPMDIFHGDVFEGTWATVLPLLLVGYFIAVIGLPVAVGASVYAFYVALSLPDQAVTCPKCGNHSRLILGAKKWICPNCYQLLLLGMETDCLPEASPCAYCELVTFVAKEHGRFLCPNCGVMRGASGETIEGNSPCPGCGKEVPTGVIYCIYCQRILKTEFARPTDEPQILAYDDYWKIGKDGMGHLHFARALLISLSRRVSQTPNFNALTLLVDDMEDLLISLNEAAQHTYSRRSAEELVPQLDIVYADVLQFEAIVFHTAWKIRKEKLPDWLVPRIKTDVPDVLSANVTFEKHLIARSAFEKTLGDSMERFGGIGTWCRDLVEVWDDSGELLEIGSARKLYKEQKRFSDWKQKHPRVGEDQPG